MPGTAGDRLSPYSARTGSCLLILSSLHSVPVFASVISANRISFSESP